jgi:hypothetical protein
MAGAAKAGRAAAYGAKSARIGGKKALRAARKSTWQQAHVSDKGKVTVAVHHRRASLPTQRSAISSQKPRPVKRSFA